MKVLVCGSRDYEDYEKLKEVLDGIGKEITCIISGHARGADTLGEKYANERNLKLEVYPADWKRYGRAAGPIRNKQMLDEGQPDLVVAFPSKLLVETKGTYNMVTQARTQKINTVVIEGKGDGPVHVN